MNPSNSRSTSFLNDRSSSPIIKNVLTSRNAETLPTTLTSDQIRWNSNNNEPLYSSSIQAPYELQYNTAASIKDSERNHPLEDIYQPNSSSDLLLSQQQLNPTIPGSHIRPDQKFPSQQNEHNSSNTFFDPNIATGDYDISRPHISNRTSNKIPIHSASVDEDDWDNLRPSDKLTLKQMWQSLEWKDLIQRKFLYWYLLIAVFAILALLIAIYHHKIVAFFKPAAEWLRSKPWGWLIPVLLLIVVSIPPLFGAEIIQILIGQVYGIWIGFAIAVGGTVIGEIIDFYLFRTLLSAKARRLEQSNMIYACLAHIVREGGFTISLIARWSALPGHITTAVFSTVGMNFWIYLAAAILSTPKMFIPIYLGYIISTEDKSITSKRVSQGVLIFTVIVTLIAGWWIWRKMVGARPYVAREWRRRKRAERLATSSQLESSYNQNETERRARENTDAVLLPSSPNILYPPNIQLKTQDNPSPEMLHGDFQRYENNADNSYPPHSTQTSHSASAFKF